MMLTPNDRKKEADAEKSERDGRYDLAASKWETIGKDYADSGRTPKSDCCYFCESGRAYSRAARDYKEAGKKAPKDKAYYEDLADKAFAKAAKLFLQCGDDCFERGEFACALAGYAQAEAHYAALEKKAKAAGDKPTEDDANKKRKHAKDASNLIDKLQERAAKAESQKLKSLTRLADAKSALFPRVWLGARFDRSAPVVRGTLADSPANRSGLRPGDRITSVDRWAVESTGELCFLIRGLTPRKQAQMTVRRQRRSVQLRLVPAINIYAMTDHVDKVVDDRRCDADCACKKFKKNVACATSYTYKGEGPNGGVMLLLRCAAISKTFEILDQDQCGPHEFI